jgi:DNA-binding IclR family transcriptional regulator
LDIIEIQSYNVRKMGTKQISGLKKGLEILCCFDSDHHALYAKEIAEELGLPPSTIYRYLDTLVSTGFLNRSSEDRKYRLGYLLVHLGETVASKMSFADVVKPHMDGLSSACRETVLLLVRSGPKAVCVAKKESLDLIKVSLEIGLVLPLHGGSSSKVLLAYQSDAFVDEYLENNELRNLTDFTITDKKVLREELQRIRSQGYALSDQEVNPGVGGIAAPVFDNKGRILASLAVAGPNERVIRNKSSIIPHLKEFAGKASQDLGYHS